MKKNPEYIVHHRVTSDNSIENLEWVPRPERPKETKGISKKQPKNNDRTSKEK